MPPIVLDGTTGITTPGLTNTGTETLVNLTTTGNTILGDASTDTLNVGNGGLVKDASGNVGIGVTPSAWNNIFKAVQINAQGALMATSASMQMGNNVYYDGAYKFIGTGYANRYYQATGQHVWTVSTASGSAGGAITETQAMTLDASGQLGIGTSSPSAKLHVAGTAIKVDGSSTATINLNGSAYGMVSASADLYVETAGSGNQVIFRKGGTETARIDSSGRFLVGTTSLTGGVVNIGVSNGGTSIATTWADTVYSTYMGFDSNYYMGTMYNAAGREVRLVANSNDSNAKITFYTGPTGTPVERARIDSSGNLLVGTTSGSGKTYSYNTGNIDTLVAHSTSTTYGQTLVNILAQRNTTNNTFYAIAYYNLGASAYKFVVADSGNVTNTNNSYGAISDVKLKENIVDATPKLEKLNKVRVVNYNFIGDQQKQLGVIAQELEQVFPGMIDESPDKDAEGNDLGTTTKSVKYSVFVPMLIKALQEQQAIIQSLTARITALENK